MAQCRHCFKVPDKYGMFKQDFVMVGKDCEKNTSRENSEALFIRKEVCNKCFEEVLNRKEKNIDRS